MNKRLFYDEFESKKMLNPLNGTVIQALAITSGHVAVSQRGKFIANEYSERQYQFKRKENMSKFKVGDKVRLIRHAGGGAHVGDVGRIRATNGISYIVDGFAQSGYMVSAKHIELVKARTKRWKFQVGEKVAVIADHCGYHPEMIGQEYTILRRIKGLSEPYMLDNGTYAAVSELARVSETKTTPQTRTVIKTVVKEKIVVKLVKKEEEDMGTIREKIRELARSKDEKNAIKTGFLSDQGNLTDVGRRTLLDYIWETDESLRTQVYADIAKVVDEECKAKKSK